MLFLCFTHCYKITKLVCAFWLVKNPWFLGCWENTQKACKSLALGLWFTSFSRVLPTSRVFYHAGKPIESVVYCLNKTWVFGQSKCAQGLIYVIKSYESSYCATTHAHARKLKDTTFELKHTQVTPKWRQYLA